MEGDFLSENYMAELMEMSKQMAGLQAEVSSLKSDMKSTWTRIEEQRGMIDTVHELALSVRDLANEQKNQSTSLTALRKDVDDLRLEPGKRWNHAVSTLIGAIIALIVGFFAGYLGVSK